MIDKTKFLGKPPSLWKRVHKIIVAIEPWGILIAILAILLTVVQFWIDYKDRVRERTVRAWTIVTTRAPGNSGKIEALEYLNNEDGLLCRGFWEGCRLFRKQRVPLVGIDLSPSKEDSRTFLRKVDLSGANLSDSDLSHADLRDAILCGADLSGASLDGADLRDTSLDRGNLYFASLDGANLSNTSLDRASLYFANLDEADLRDASLVEAALIGAELRGANLYNADLSEANLTGADFSGAHWLSQNQLDEACVHADFPPVLPNGLVWKGNDCPKSWYSKLRSVDESCVSLEGFGRGLDSLVSSSATFP